MTSFLESNKDFVLKLKIQTANQTQIRRVSLPRIADASGNISYDELVGLVLVFSLPEEDSSRVNTSNYTVSLTYYDDEKDLITLASTEELKEAIELFANEKFVRITTSVKRKTTYSSAPTPKHYAQDSTNQTQSPQDPPMKAVLESFAGILSTAVSNLQEGLAKQSPDSPSGDASQLKTPPAPNTGCKNQKGLRAGNKADKATCTKSVTSAAASVKVGPSSEQKKEPEKKPPAVSGNKKKEPVDSPPFIHGRHTCDGCLTTPIIGKRYHATNLPDYDLCQKCFDNYKGSEIKYEPVELPRDHHYQSRWRTRQETNARIMAMRKSARSSWNRPYVPPRTCPTRKSPSPPRGSNTAKTNQTVADTVPTIPVRHDNPLDFGDFEDSLKEAIRRSLDDATKKAKETEKIIAKEVQNIEQQAAVIEQKAAELQQTLEKSVETMTKTVIDEASELKKEKVPTSSVEKMSDTTNDIPRSVDIIENNTADVERLENSDAMSEKASVSLEVEDEETLQKAMDTESVDSEKLVSEPSEGEVLPTLTDILSPSPSSKQKGPNTPKNESFASDAVGSGDVAEVMGKTLDMVAGVISEMLEESGEMEGIVREILEESGEMVESSEDAKESNENLDAESSPGEIIVNSDDDVSETDEGEDDADWSVVKSIGSNGTTESRKIGRATEMLGSALFNSDMKSSADGLSSNSMQSESSFSVPSSVPTELGTVTSRPATSSPALKWAAELQTLKELGFDDEECCIGALERIKSDSKTNDIDMELVVNQLLFLNS